MDMKTMSFEHLVALRNVSRSSRDPTLYVVGSRRLPSPSGPLPPPFHSYGGPDTFLFGSASVLWSASLNILGLPAFIVVVREVFFSSFCEQYGSDHAANHAEARGFPSC